MGIVFTHVCIIIILQIAQPLGPAGMGGVKDTAGQRCGGGVLLDG